MQLNEFAMKRTWGPAPRLDRVMAYEPSETIPDEAEFFKIAGPCSVESEKQISTLAKIAKDNGATHLRGGVFRAGTYPGNKFGLVEETLLAAYQKAAHDNGLKNIIEVLDYSPTALEYFDRYADCFQVGCRQMQNYTLLRKIAQYGKTVFIKRNPGATIDEFLGAAEHVLAASGNFCDVVLIERGSSTNARHVRWDLSISMIPAIKAITKIPILVDASHGTGRRDLVEPMTLAGVAAGADGLLVEFHEEPEKSLSDSEQALSIYEFQMLMAKVNKLREVL